MQNLGSVDLELLEAPFGDDTIEEKSGMLYVPHEIVRERLIQATGNCFSWKIEQVIFRDDGVTRRSNDNTGAPRRPMSMIVIGTLSIPGLGERAGVGAHPLDEGAGEDAAYKSAESDALKRAAMAFGVGLKQLYIDTGAKKRSGNSGPVQNRSSAPVQNRSTSGSLGDKARTPRESYPDDNQSPPEQQQTQQRSYQSNSSGGSASDKQMSFLKKLLEENGWSMDQFDFDGFEKNEASAWIESLTKTKMLPDGVTDPNA